MLNFLWPWLGCDIFGFVFIWAFYRHSYVFPCTHMHYNSSIFGHQGTPSRQSLGAGRRSRMYAWRLCPGRAFGKSSCLPCRLHKQTNVIKKSFEYRCDFLYKDLFRFLPLPGICWFFSLFIWALVNGIHFSMSALLHFSLLPARRLTHAVIHGRITGAASAFEASLLERWLPGLFRGPNAGTKMLD